MFIFIDALFKLSLVPTAVTIDFNTLDNGLSMIRWKTHVFCGDEISNGAPLSLCL